MIENLVPSYFEWWHIPVIFLAGMVGEGYGCIIGGGGIPIQAAQVFVGVPIKSAIVTSTVGGFGTEAGILSETHKQVAKNKKLTVLMAIPYTIGGILGIWLLLHLPPDVIRYIMVVAVLVVLVHALHARGRERPQSIRHSQYAFLFLFMFLAGTYGAIGPGEGNSQSLP